MSDQSKNYFEAIFLKIDHEIVPTYSEKPIGYSTLAGIVPIFTVKWSQATVLALVS
jgi:hypothetical protein